MRPVLKPNKNPPLFILIVSLLISVCLIQSSYADAGRSSDKLSHQIKLIYSKLGQTPNNVDLLVKLARLLINKGQYESALNMLHKAATLAPEYEDIYLLEAILLAQSKQRDACLHKSQLLERYGQITKRRYHATIKRHLLTMNRGYTEISTGMGHDNLTNGRTDWQNHYLTISHVNCARQTFYAGYESVQRYNITEADYHTGITLSFTDVDINIEYHRSDAGNILAKQRFSGELNYHGIKGIGLILRHQLRNYRLLDTAATGIALDYYFADYQVLMSNDWVSTSAANQDFADATHTQYQFYWHYGDRRNIGLVYAYGTELNYDGTATPPFSKVKSLFIKGMHNIIPQWTLTYGLKAHQQGTYFNQYGANLGVRYRY